VPHYLERNWCHRMETLININDTPIKGYHFLKLA
jgi:hypothetical protein